MLGCGFQFGSLDSKCSSCVRHSHLFILGLILARYTTVSSRLQPSPVNCKTVFSNNQRCGLQPDGVHDLDCFGKHTNPGVKTCVWRPGNHTSDKTYTLLVRQQERKFCKVYTSITKLSVIVRVFEDYNLTAEVFENAESANCTKAVFRGSANGLLRCGPPRDVTFSRQSGKLDVSVSWHQEDAKAIRIYSVRYKALGSLSWHQPLLQSQNGGGCRVENLNSSLFYVVQVRCVTNSKCSQCPWSETYTVPPELTSQPVIFDSSDALVEEERGRRLVSLKWQFPAKEPRDGFHVTVSKASGEAPSERISTDRSEVWLVLSCSDYQVNVSAVNNASTSPAGSWSVPQREDAPCVADGRVNVTVHDRTSFTVYWRDDLIKTHVCYSAEWRTKGRRAVHMSFHQNENNYRTLSPLPEPLEPYERYSIALHTRPNRATCNMEHVNNSESTYGTAQFYFMEGTPISAPNISSCHGRLDSATLQWSAIPEEDARGFLLGYIVHYTKDQHRHQGSGARTEKNVTVDPEFDTYELGDLHRDTYYWVEISAFTRAGAGGRSTACIFKTHHPGYFAPHLIGVIVLFAVVVTLLTFGSLLIKRAKDRLWPSIPNPRDSSALIHGPCEMSLLKSLTPLKMEECDTNSLQVVEREEAAHPGPVPPPQTAQDWIHGDAEGDTGATPLVDGADTFSSMTPTYAQSSSFAFSTEYTTVEMFLRGMPGGSPARTAAARAVGSDPGRADATVAKPGFDDGGQCSSGPDLDSEDTFAVF